MYREKTMQNEQKQEKDQSGKGILLGIIGFIMGTIALIVLIKFVIV